MSKRKVHLENNYNRPNGICGKKHYKGMRLTINYEEITCKLCKDGKKQTQLQVYSCQYSRLLGDIAMVKACLQRIFTTVNTPPWSCSPAYLEKLVRDWYAIRKAEELEKRKLLVSVSVP